jgi:hypothetical protein
MVLSDAILDWVGSGLQRCRRAYLMRFMCWVLFWNCNVLKQFTYSGVLYVMFML